MVKSSQARGSAPSAAEVLHRSSVAPKRSSVPPDFHPPPPSPGLAAIGHTSIGMTTKGKEVARPPNLPPHLEDVGEQPYVPRAPACLPDGRQANGPSSATDDVRPGPSHEPAAVGPPAVAPAHGAHVPQEGLSWAQQDLYQYLKSTSWDSSPVVAAIRASGGKGDNGSRTLDVIRQWAHVVGTLTELPTPYADPKRIRITSGVLGLFLQHSDDWSQNAYSVYRYLQQEPTNEGMRNAIASLGTRPMGMGAMARFLRHYAV